MQACREFVRVPGLVLEWRELDDLALPTHESEEGTVLDGAGRQSELPPFGIEGSSVLPCLYVDGLEVAACVRQGSKQEDVVACGHDDRECEQETLASICVLPNGLRLSCGAGAGGRTEPCPSP
jgi:hypothetical protein